MSATYRNPTPTVDVVIRIGDGIVLIRRRNEPVGWALPGGFVDEGETVEAAAVREAMEETGLEITLQDLLYVYSNPARDRRKHTLSVVFTATADGTPRGMDDAAEARIFSLDVAGCSRSSVPDGDSSSGFVAEEIPRVGFRRSTRGGLPVSSPWITP